MWPRLSERAKGDTEFCSISLQVKEFGREARVAETLRAGEALIVLYAQLHMHFDLYATTYGDMFDCVVTRRRSLPKGRELALQVAKYYGLFYGEDHALVAEWLGYAEDPSHYVNYLRLDKL